MMTSVPDPLFDVSAECVVLTGTAGQLGSRYARALLERGARVDGLDGRTSPAVEALMQEWPEHYRHHQVSITDAGALRQVLSSMDAEGRTPTVLINNAAIDAPPSAPPEETGPFETYPEASWDRVLDVNLKGTFLCCQVFGGAMAAAGRGSVINVASIYGVVAPDQRLYEYRRRRGETFVKPVAYAASKSGVLNLTRYLAAYWAPRGVRVNTLTIAGVFNHQDPEFLEAYCARIPVGRMADPDEYDGAVIYLSSPASRYMTGANLVLDGGWTAI